MYNGQFSGYPFQQQQQQQQPCQTYAMLPPYNFGEYVEPYHQNGQIQQQQQQPFHEHLQQQYPMYQQPPPQIQQNPMHGIFQQQYPPLEQQYPPFLQIEPTPMLERLPDIPRITQELSKNLDPEYSKELDVLYILLSNATTKEEKETVFCGFEKKFLILPFLWQYRLQLISQSFMIQAISDAEKQVTKKALYDFYSIDTFSRYQKSFKCFDKTFLSDWRRSTWDKNHFGQLYDYVVKAKEGLFFPHENLIDVFKFYEAYSDQILLQRDYIKYKKALQQCHRIISATSLRELFCYFTQIDDPKVVIQNVELLIAQNPTCQWLWKSYLQFLRDRQPKVYLDVFQKYIRFFINDKQMIAYFGQEQQRIYSTINLNFYQSLETFLIDDIKPELNYLPQHSFRLHNFSTFKNAFVQKYSLPPPLIQYILRKASAKQLSSLFETCKHLFLLQTTPICCHLMVSNYLMYDERNSRSPCCQQSFKFSYFVPREFQNIFLVKSLIIESPKPATMLSAIIGKISRCEIWCLNVKGQTVFWNELRFLLESGNVEKFVFTGGCITVGYGQMATIEDVIGMLPKAHTVILDSAAFTPQTFSTLSKFNRTKKFKEFTIEKVTSCFRIFDFEYFIMKHAAPASNFNFVFEVFTPNDFIKKFNNFIKNLFRDWSPTKIKPKICITKKKK